MSQPATFDDVLKEVAIAYPESIISAGFQIAWVPEKDEFYAAVHQFPGNVASRKIIAKAMGTTSGEAISKCLAIWRDIKRAEADSRVTTGG